MRLLKNIKRKLPYAVPLVDGIINYFYPGGAAVFCRIMSNKITESAVDPPLPIDPSVGSEKTMPRQEAENSYRGWRSEGI